MFIYCDGTLICYQDSFTSPNGLTDGSAGGTQRRVIIYGDGEEAFCIQPGVPLNTGDQLTANASEAWNALSSTQKEAVKLALAYGNREIVLTYLVPGTLSILLHRW